MANAVFICAVLNLIFLVPFVVGSLLRVLPKSSAAAGQKRIAAYSTLVNAILQLGFASALVATAALHVPERDINKIVRSSLFCGAILEAYFPLHFVSSFLGLTLYSWPSYLGSFLAISPETGSWWPW